MILGDDRPARHRRQAGHAIEYAGEAIRALAMEGRMTVCNMSIEGGGRAGMIAPDETTFDYVARPPGRARGLRRGGRALARAAHRRGRHLRRRGRDRRRRRSRRWSPGAPTPGMVAEVDRRGARPGRDGRRRPTARRPSAPSPTWALRARHADDRDRARPGLHRLLHQLADRGPARGRRDRRGPQGRRAVRAMVVPGSSRSRRRPRPRGWTTSSAPPASSGARRAARCAWA